MKILTTQELGRVQTQPSMAEKEIWRLLDSLQKTIGEQALNHIRF